MTVDKKRRRNKKFTALLLSMVLVLSMTITAMTVTADVNVSLGDAQWTEQGDSLNVKICNGFW